MKNYEYMIFLTILPHLKPPQFTPKWRLPTRSPILKVSHQNGNFPLGHLSSKCSGPSTLNFRVPFAWVTPTLIIAYWYYSPFNPYKPYVCECRSVCMWVWVLVCMCVLVWVSVCVRMWVCVSAKNTKNLKTFKKSQKFQKNPKTSKNLKTFRNPNNLKKPT
jgi:hypothetical protein